MTKNIKGRILVIAILGVFLWLKFDLQPILGQCNKPTISASGPTTFCAGSSVTLSGPASPTIITTSTLAGNGTFGIVNGTATNAQFKRPNAVACDAKGNVYIAESLFHIIRKIDPAGNVSTFAGIVGSSGYADGPGATAKFDTPSGLAFDKAGNLYVADSQNDRIRKIDTAGNVSTFAGEGSNIGVDNNGLNYVFNFPVSVAVSPSGNVFVANSQSNIIHKINKAGFVSQVSGSNIPILISTNPALYNSVAIDELSAVAVDAAGNVYGADKGNHRIFKVDTAYNYSIIGGNGSPGFLDGPSANSQFNTPLGIAVDASGNVYVADALNARIRKIDAAGNATTVAGTVFGFLDGGGGTSKFNYPSAVAIDAANTLYVTDQNNLRIRKITQVPALNSYLWSNSTTGEIIPGTTQNLTVNSGKLYTLQTTFGGCTSAKADPVDVRVNSVTTPTITTSGSTSLCASTNVTLTANGGTKYIWSNGATTASITVSAAGSYTVQSVSGSCTSSVSNPVTITPNVNLPAPVILGSATYTLCQTVDPPVPPVLQVVDNGYTYLWSDGSTGTTLATPNQAGTYTVRAISNGCTSAASSPVVITMISPSTPVITASGKTNLCKGESVTLTASGGVNNVYEWNNGSTTSSIVVTETGVGGFQVRTFVAYPGGNCYSDWSNNISVNVTTLPTPVTTIGGNGSNIICNGGSVTLNSTCINCVWSNTTTGTNTITVSTPGTYFTTESDGTCSVNSNMVEVYLASQNQPEVIANDGPEICAGGSITLVADPGNSGIPIENFTFLWNNGKTGRNLIVSSAGNYSFTYSLPGGCTSVSSAGLDVTINNGSQAPAAPSISNSTPLTFCKGGSVDLTASGSTDFIWSDGTKGSVANFTESGTYSVRAVDNGCTSVSSAPVVVTVTSVTTPTVAASGSTSFCSGGSVTLTASGGTSYVWSNGAKTASITVSTAGSYTVQSVSGSCTSSASAAIVVSVLGVTPTITASGSTSLCSGGSVTLTANGGTNYIWSNGATTASITVSAAGSFTVQSVSGSCTSSASAATVVSVGNLTTPTIAASGSTSLCAGGSVTLTANGGTNYIWSNGATTASITVSAAGSFTVQSVSGSCTSAASAATVVYIGNLTTPTIAASGSTSLCAGGNVTLTANGGTNYVWSNGATTASITVSVAGSFTVQSVSGSCTSSVSAATVVSVGNLTTPTIAASGSTSLCAGGNVTLTANGGTNYVWSNGATTASITVSAAGSLTVQSVSGSCTSAASAATVVSVGNLTTPSITASGSTSLCAGGNVTLTANGGTNYLWSNGASTASITVSAAGSFTVQSVSGSCTSSASAATVVSVGNLTTPSITASGSTSLCAGGNVTLTANGGTNYIWSNGATTASITVSTAGSFTVQSVSGSCTSAASAATVVSVGNLTTPSISASGSTSLCAGGNVTLTANGGTNYVWSNGATTASITVSSAGSFTVQSVSGSCTSAASAATVVSVVSCGNNWTGTTSSDWSDPLNWSAGSLPTANSDVTIPSAQRNPVIATAVSLKSLTVSNGVNLVVNATLNLSGNLVNNGSVSGSGTLKLSGTTAQTISGSPIEMANLTIANTDVATLNTPVGVGGSVSLNSGTLNANGNLILRSTANGTALIDNFSSGNTGTITGNVKAERYFPGSGWHFVAAPVTGSTLAATGLTCSNIQTWSEALNTTTAATAGCATNNFDVNATIIVNKAAGTKYTITGTANTGDYIVNLVRGAGSSPQRGFNYVANPYPSPISWTSVIATSGLTANSNGTAYIWNPATLTYGTISSAGVVTGSANNLIQSGQGFLVRRNTLSSAGPASMTFKNSQRVNTNSASFIRKPVTEQSMRLVLKSENSEDDILLYTSAEASVDMDHLDAEKLHSHLLVASISSGNDLAINALPTDFIGTVALNLSAPKAGVYHLSVKELANVNVTLEDKKTGTFTVLSPETKLDLNLNESNEGRFVLHYGVGNSANQTQIFAADKLVTVMLPTADNAVIEAVNTIGQVVSTVNATDKVTRFALPKDGVYVIRVKSGNGVKSGKVIY